MDPKQKRADAKQKDEIHPELQQVLKTLGTPSRDLERQLGYSYGSSGPNFSSK